MRRMNREHVSDIGWRKTRREWEGDWMKEEQEGMGGRLDEGRTRGNGRETG